MRRNLHLLYSFERFLIIISTRKKKKEIEIAFINLLILFNHLSGMTESIVAAAASRVGKRVLHLDRFVFIIYLLVLKLNLLLIQFYFSNEYYGGLWATFNFDGLQKWIEDLKTIKSEPTNFKPTLEAGEKFLQASSQYSTVENICEEWFVAR